DNIPPGADFRRHIERVLDESDIVLAIIGPRWVGPDHEQRRLSSPADPVRIEIETALQKNKPLIPVLVSRAVIPPLEALPDSLHDFAYRTAVQVDSGQDFDFPCPPPGPCDRKPAPERTAKYRTVRRVGRAVD